MPAIDHKYGAITAEKKEFHDGEPVFVLRGGDALAPLAILDYARRCSAAGCDREHYEDVVKCSEEMRAWQEKNQDKVKNPD